MLRYVIFAIYTALLTFGFLSHAQDPAEPVFIDVVLNDANNSPIDVEFGPCRWKMDGAVVGNSSVGKTETSKMVTHAERENGYRMGLVCQEARQQDLEVQLGLAWNVSGTELFKSDYQVFVEPIDEGTIYLKFTKKWGSRTD